MQILTWKYASDYYVASLSQNHNNSINLFPFSTLPNRLDPFLRLNAICPYYTMFPLEFPFSSLSDAVPGDWVLDPFCGRGTTNYAARLRNLRSIGIDSNPVATSVARAKFVNPKYSQVTKLCKKIIEDDIDPEEIPQGKFWDLCYHPSTLLQICILREQLKKDCSTDTRIALRALMLGVLHGPLRRGLPSYLSNQMPRTYATKPNSAINFWEKRNLSPSEINVVDVVERKSKYLFTYLPPKIQGEILETDNRCSFSSSIKTKFNWIITSPPYYGMSSYTPDQWLRKWFLGGTSQVDYSQKLQLCHGSESSFAHELSQVWKNVADVCTDGAHMIIRFGSLPSLACDPKSLLEHSLQYQNSEWEILDIRDAGIPRQGMRQAEQFNNSNLGGARNEIDLHAIFIG